MSTDREPARLNKRKNFKFILGSRSSRTLSWNLVATSASLFTGILTARSLGPEDRGSLGLAVSVAGLGVLIGALGSNVSIRRHLPKANGVSSRSYSVLSLLLLPSTVILLCGLLLFLAGSVDENFASPLVGLAFIVYGISYYLSNQSLDLLNALGLVPLAARTNATGSIVCLALVFAASQLGLGLPAVICSFAISVLIQALIAWRYANRALRDRESSFSGWKSVRILLADGVRLLGLNVGQSLTYRADLVVLGAISTTTAVGYYSVATTPAALLRLPVNAVGQVAFYDAAKNIQVRKVLRTVIYLEFLLVPLALIGWIVADLAVVFVFGEAYAAAAAALRVLLIAELCLAPFLVVSRALAGGGSRTGASVSGIVGAAVLLVFCFFLIPEFAEVGAAWASVVAYSAMSATSLFFLLFRRPMVPGVWTSMV